MNEDTDDVTARLVAFTVYVCRFIRGSQKDTKCGGFLF
jgi:hypothetical protein